MTNIESLISNGSILYADMKEYLRSGEWEMEYDTPAAVSLRYRRDVIHAMAAFDLAAARQMLAQIPGEDVIVIRGCEGLQKLAAEFGFNGCHPCWQVVYDKTATIPIDTELLIRHPDEKDFSKIRAHYDLGDEAELRYDFERPDFLGGYLDGELVGFAGLHVEGSMGLLHVLEPYRRRGYAEAIYGTLINNQLAKGRLPFAQIIEGNEASMELHRKLDFRIADELIYWMWRE